MLRGLKVEIAEIKKKIIRKGKKEYLVCVILNYVHAVNCFFTCFKIFIFHKTFHHQHGTNANYLVQVNFDEKAYAKKLQLKYSSEKDENLLEDYIKEEKQARKVFKIQSGVHELE